MAAACPPASRAPAPIDPPTLAGPSQYRLRPHNEQHVPPAGEPLSCQDPESPIGAKQPGPWRATLEDNQLLSQAQVLCHQQRLRLQKCRDRPRHPSYHKSLPLIVAAAGVLHPIRLERSSRMRFLRPTGKFGPDRSPGIHDPQSRQDLLGDRLSLFACRRVDRGSAKRQSTCRRNGPGVSDETIESILHANPFDHWWHGRLTF